MFNVPVESADHKAPATVNCLLCGSSMAPWLRVAAERLKPSDLRNQLYWCGACRFGSIEPRPSQAELLQYYGAGYYTHAAAESPSQPKSFLSRLRTHVAWRFDRRRAFSATDLREFLSDASLLCEIGSGSGKFLRDAADQGFKTFGIEPDPAALAVARSRGLEVAQGTAEMLPSELQPGTFDAMLMSHVLEHCLDPKKALANARRLLKPRGLLFVIVPNNECLGLRNAGPAWRWLDVPRHVNFFTGASLLKLTTSAGFDVQRTAYEGYCRQFSDAWIAEERRIGTELGSPPVNSWLLLARTLFASDSRKYDTVCMVAKREA